MDRLVLASASPRRRELLAQLGVAFDVVPADVDETPRAGERPLALVRRLAAAKARAVDGDPVLAADTIVEVDGEILGKPVDDADARRMLRRLSARSHRVHTGVAAAGRGAARGRRSVTTIVTFVPLLPSAIDWYLATGEPFDKAGAYAIQGAGGVFVDGDPGQRQQRRRPPADHRRPMLHDVCGWQFVTTPSGSCGTAAGPRTAAAVGSGALVSTLGSRLLTAAPVTYHWHSHRPSANAPGRSPKPVTPRPMSQWRLATMSLKPLDDRIVVLPNEAEQTTASGLVIPDTAKEKPQQGKVLAVGPGKRAEIVRRDHPPRHRGRPDRPLLEVRRHRGHHRR